MRDWHPRKKKQLRGEVLRMLSQQHMQQLSRMDDVALCTALRRFAWEVDIKDVVTILQEMKLRGWVNFAEFKNIYISRVEVSRIEILPVGQDLVDRTTTDPAVEF